MKSNNSKPHHHRSTIKQKNKPFKNKTKKSTKTLKPNGIVKTIHSNPQTKLDRVNSKKVQRINKHEKWLSKHQLPSTNSTGVNFVYNPSPPKLIALISLNQSFQSDLINKWILENSHNQNIDISSSTCGLPVIRLPNYAQHPSFGKRQSISILSTSHNLQECLDAAKCADVIVCLMGNASYENPAFDEFGYQLISSLRLQGYSRIVGLCCQIPELIETGTNKKVAETKNFARRYFHSEFGDSEKFITIEKSDDLNPLLRLLGSVAPQPLSWRKNRGYMLCEKWEYSHDSQQLAVAGYMRGSGFSLEYPVHITGIGDFIIQSIETFNEDIKNSTSTFPEPEWKIETNQETISQINNEEWESLRPYDPLEGEQTWPDVNEFADNDIEMLYDEKFYSDGSENEDLEDFDEKENYEMLQKTKFELEERSKDDLMFPDEVDTPQDQPARVRFQKYRGLKSFKQSPWDPLEDLPVEYSRIFDFDSYKQTMKACQEIFNRSALNALSKLGGSPFCRIILNNFKLEDANKLKCPIILSSLFPYEKKVTVMNFEVNRTVNYTDPVKSKDLVELDCGFRRFLARPIFSETASKSSKDKFKFEPFLHQGHPSMLSIYAPCLSPPCPLLMFKSPSIKNEEQPTLIAWGNLHSAQANRMIIKRIILTGYPCRTHKKKAIVRFMFFQPDDIRWFKKIELHTKKGLTGHIISPLGTHGYMKCVFNGFITQDDTVCMYLYKRVYPKWFPVTWNHPEAESART